MPLLSLKFLHEPLPSLRNISFERALQWQLDGLARLAPRRLREMGWRSTARILSDEEECVRERSLLGVSRLVRNGEIVDALPVAAALDEASIFEANVELPAAARDLRQAIEFRLDEISPLPPEDVVFSIGETKQAGSGRTEASIAIARKRDVEAIIDRYRSATLAEIGARLKPDGDFTYRFYEAPRGSRAGRRTLLAAGAFVLGAAALLAGANAHLDRRIEASAAYESSLLAAIKEERARASTFTAGAVALTPGLDGQGISAAFDMLIRSMPESAFIEEARIDAAGVSATFHAPVDAPSPANAAPIESARDRPGYAVYSMTAPLEPAP
ncbi:MAG: hypothetical protein RIC52_07065 [Amphiplicatus sp.]